MSKFVANEFHLIDNDDNIAFAGINLNPLVRWVKFVLTDDKPNANKQRIPKEEFGNLIKTGLYMPIKTAPFDDVSEKRHFNAEPIGAITHLKVDGDKILGLAALWEKERPEDVSKIVEAINNGEHIDLSWEVAYSESVEEDGVEVLKDVALLGTTIVDVPAYRGRTPILSVAEESNSEKWDKKYVNDLPDSAFLYIEPGGEKDKEGKTKPRSLRHLPYKDKDGNIDLNHLRNAISRLSQEGTGKGWLTEELRNKLLNKARKLLKSVNKEESEMEKLAEAQQVIEELNNKIADYEKELAELRNFKEEVERKEAEEKRIEDIKQKFVDAGINKSDEYFSTNRERLLKMEDEAVEFMIQEMVAAIAEVKKEGNKEEEKETSASIPDFSTNGNDGDLIETARKLIKSMR